MNFETRMFIYGTEAELRPVSAKDQLINIKNAKKYAEENEGGDFAEKAAFLAGMIFSSAYDGEEKLFTSFEDVLEKLTVAEISEIGNEIYTPVSLPEITASDAAESGANRNIYTMGAETSDILLTSGEKPLSEDENQKPHKMDLESEDYSLPKREEPISEDENFIRVVNKADDLILKLNKMGVVTEKEESGEIKLRKSNSFFNGLNQSLNVNKTSYPNDSSWNANVNEIFYPKSGALKTSMQNISDFFEKDSRRYDCSIS